MSFANLLTVYNEDEQIPDSCAAFLTQRNIAFERISNTFFVQTPNKQATSDLIAALKTTEFTYTFLFINNIDGSALRSNNIDQNKLDRVSAILALLTS